MDKHELWSKPVEYQFTEDEVKFLKTQWKKSSMIGRYAIYKKPSHKKLYLAFFIDLMPSSPRRSGVENMWDFREERPLTNIEYDEVIRNYGRNNRRFITWSYRTIENLQVEDRKYNIETPERFVKHCRELGFSGGYQARMDFDNYTEF